MVNMSQLFGALSLGVSVAVAQQFPLFGYQYDSLGLSQTCTEALNTSVSCSDLLATNAADL